MKKIDVSLLTEPTRIDSNNYTAMTTSGHLVKFKREVVGWDIRVEIHVNGYCVHINDNAGEVEKQMWATLSRNADTYRTQKSIQTKKDIELDLKYMFIN